MPPRRQSKRATGIYQRGTRWWGQIRDQRFPLVAPGERLATTDDDSAKVLYGLAVTRAAQRRQSRTLLGYDPEDAKLAAFAAEHLKAKAQSTRNYTEAYLASEQKRLEHWIACLGADRPMAEVSVADVAKEIRKLSARGLSAQTVTHYANALSNLYHRAIREGCLPPGSNPIEGLGDERPKPPADRLPRWFESDEAALLLVAAERYTPKREDLSAGMALPLFATLLLTGLRREEALGLRVRDIDFDGELVHVEPNPFRRLKSRHATRTVPLVPQLAAILRDFLDRRRAAGIPHTESLLFPSARTAGMFNPSKMMAGIARTAGYDAKALTCHSLRHTFTAAALQTLDSGQPISPYVVQRWLGHGSVTVTLSVYAKLGKVRHRSDAVEFRLPAGGAGLRSEVRERIERLGWRDLLGGSTQPVSHSRSLQAGPLAKLLLDNTGARSSAG